MRSWPRIRRFGWVETQLVDCARGDDGGPHASGVIKVSQRSPVGTRLAAGSDSPMAFERLLNRDVTARLRSLKLRAGRR